MKPIATATLLVMFCTPAFAASISPSDAGKYVGKSVTVEGVAQITMSNSGVMFIDMGGKYPNIAFSGFISKANVAKFPAAMSYSGKTLDITGTVTMYKGMPEIVLTKPSQVTVK